MLSTIYLDMDGVICDFVKAALQLHEFDGEVLLGEPDLRKVVGLSSLGSVLEGKSFWEPIYAQGVSFWENLEETQYFVPLMELIGHIDTDWYILSTPSGHGTDSHVGKIKWLRKRFGERFSRFLLTEHKHLLARPGAVLIDDSEANCVAFTKHGGKAIMFPTAQNRMYNLRVEPLTYVKKQLLHLIQEISYALDIR